MLRHADDLLSRGGEHCLALGTDFDGCEDTPEGLRTVGDMENLAEAMLRHGYLESTVNALFYGNAVTFAARILRKHGERAVLRQRGHVFHPDAGCIKPEHGGFKDMDYVSSRDKKLRVSAAQAIAAGIAPGGGLFCPTEFPALTADEMQALLGKDYKGRAAHILGKFLTDFTAEELADFAAKAYADEKFGGADTAPVKSLSDGVHMLELWHGPTCAFKDMALQMLPRHTPMKSSAARTPHRSRACRTACTCSSCGTARPARSRIWHCRCYRTC